MMRVLIMFGVGIAVVVAAGTGYFLGKNSSAEAAHKSAVEECEKRFGIIEAVVAKKDIPTGGELTRDNLAVKRLPAEGISSRDSFI